MGVERESWRIVEMIIRRYPDKKKEYDEYVSDIISSNPNGSSTCTYDEDYSKPQSITEAKAMKMTSVYAAKIKKEIEAVEFVYNNLRPEEQKVMRERFWTDRKRNIPYLHIKSVSYSERQMKRIVFKIIIQVGRYLGEIK